jgi:site-specific DNA recombinase
MSTGKSVFTLSLPCGLPRSDPLYATTTKDRNFRFISFASLHGEAKTASAGSVSRIPAADIEDVIVKSLQQHLAANQGKATTSAESLGNCGTLTQLPGLSYTVTG